MISLSMDGLAYISVAISACLAISLLLLNIKQKKQYQQQLQKSQQLEEQIKALTQQLSMINKGTLGMGKRLMTTEKRLNQTMERQETLENKEVEQLHFKQAAKLFERGLEMDNVIEKVGITRSEAKLVDMFQQKRVAEAGE